MTFTGELYLFLIELFAILKECVKFSQRLTELSER